MAHFLIAIDPDPERRSRFVRDIEDRSLAPTDDLAVNRCASGSFCAVWAANRSEPVSAWAEGDRAAVLWGAALAPEGPNRLDAATLASSWENLPSKIPEPLDGFHCAASWDREGFRAGADLLGVCPVYYWQSGPVLLVASSPEPFRLHPLFKVRLDPAGLAGILLSNGLVDGRTLLEGVRRLGAGNLLLWKPGSSPREIPQYRIPATDRFFHLPYERQVDRVEEELERALRRHLPPGRPYGFLCSGGLDSRMMGGYLLRGGLRPEAFVFGRPDDLEMRCALPVVRELGFKPVPVAIDPERYVQYAEWESRWRQLSNGFSTIMFWQSHPALSDRLSGFTTGWALDCVVGGDQIEWAKGEDGTLSFERFFSRSNRWGVAPDRLKRLLRPPRFSAQVDEVAGRMREIYEGYSERPHQKPWCFDLYHRQRFHTSAVLGLHARWSWPAVPCVDRRVLDLLGGMPPDSVAGRRIQKDLLCRRFPGLARLPLDRNSHNTRPLMPRYGKLIDKWFYKGAELVNSARSRVDDPRFYYRIMDFNGEGWTAVRREAEPHRGRLLELLNEEILGEILPGPETRVEAADRIIDTSQSKLLLGLILWAKDRL